MAWTESVPAQRSRDPRSGGPRRAGRRRRRGRPRDRHVFLLSDVLLLPLAAYLSFVLRLDSFDLEGAPEAWDGALLLAGLAVALGPASFHRFGVYARDWADASLDDLSALGTAVLAASAAVAALWWAGPATPLAPWVLFPRSAPVVLGFLTLSAAGGPRLAARLLAGGHRGGRPRSPVVSALAVGAEAASIAAQAAPRIGGAARLARPRPVETRDLLRRAPLEADLAAAADLLRGRRVLVTGAGGSIGSELCRQVLALAPAELVLLGHGEHSIFTLHRELEQWSRRRAGTTLHTVIADVCAPERLRSVFREHRPEVVFHAAAHKHVPLMELNPTAAAANNVLGTRNVVAAARLAGVERLVLISTDKAVNPRSVMGATKRAAELVVHQAALRTGAGYLVARFGNVLGSRGSVLRTMEQQIAAGGPVTVTHPDMTRYFMTIPEAAQLLLQAAALGRGGGVFVFDMGEPVRILDLAEDLIRRSGLRPGEDVEIAFTGVRPGEKLHEQLMLPGERYAPTAHRRIFAAGQPEDEQVSGLEAKLRALETAVQADDQVAVLQALQWLVPEYRPDIGSPTVQVGAGAAEPALDPGVLARAAVPLWASP